MQEVDDGADNTTAAAVPVIAPVNTAQALDTHADESLSSAFTLRLQDNENRIHSSPSLPPTCEWFSFHPTSQHKTLTFLVRNPFFGVGAPRPSGYATPRAPSVESLTSPGHVTPRAPTPEPLTSSSASSSPSPPPIPPPAQPAQAVLPAQPAFDNSVVGVNFADKLFKFFSEPELENWITSIGASANLIQRVELRSHWEVYVDAADGDRIKIKPLGEGVFFTEALRGLPNVNYVKLYTSFILPWQRRKFPDHHEIGEKERERYHVYALSRLQKEFADFQRKEFASRTIVVDHDLRLNGTWVEPAEQSGSG